MTEFKFILLGVSILVILSSSKQNKTENEKALPNVILILADDMGYGEIEALDPERSKIPTPKLNQLASAYTNCSC